MDYQELTDRVLYLEAVCALLLRDVQDLKRAQESRPRRRVTFE